MFRLSDDGWVRCHAAHSIAAIVESWLHFLENDFLSVSPYKQIVVRGSTFEVENGPSSFEMLFPAWPTANPLAIDHYYDRDNPEHVDFIARHTEGYEFDPRGSELHPESDDFFAEHTDDLNAELTSLEVAFRRRTT